MHAPYARPTGMLIYVNGKFTMKQLKSLLSVSMIYSGIGFSVKLKMITFLSIFQKSLLFEMARFAFSFV
jgi:hypothetical protein